MNNSLRSYLQRKLNISTPTEFARNAELPLSTAKRLWYGEEGIQVYPKTLLALSKGLCIPTYEIAAECKLKVSFGTRNSKHETGDLSSFIEEIKEGRHIVRSLRRANGYSLRYVAAEIGVDKLELMRYERDRKNELELTSEQLKKLLALLTEHQIPTIEGFKQFYRERFGSFRYEDIKLRIRAIFPFYKELVPAHSWIYGYIR